MFSTPGMMQLETPDHAYAGYVLDLKYVQVYSNQ